MLISSLPSLQTSHVPTRPPLPAATLSLLNLNGQTRSGHPGGHPGGAPGGLLAEIVLATENAQAASTDGQVLSQPGSVCVGVLVAQGGFSVLPLISLTPREPASRLTDC